MSVITLFGIIFGIIIVLGFGIFFYIIIINIIDILRGLKG